MKIKNPILVGVIAAMLAGCAYHRTTETTYNPETQSNDRTTFTGIVWFNRAAVEGLTVGRRTTNETSTLEIAKGGTETQAEAIKAVGEALGAGLVSGAKKSVIP